MLCTKFLENCWILPEEVLFGTITISYLEKYSQMYVARIYCCSLLQTSTLENDRKPVQP